MQKEKVDALPIEYSVIPYKKDIGGTRCYRYFTIVQSDVADSLKRQDCPVLYRSRDFSKCLTFAKYFFNVADLKNQYELNMDKCWIAVRGIKYHPAKDAWLWWVSQKQEDIKFIFDEPQESITRNLSATVRRQHDAIATLKHEAKIRERRLSELESAVTTLSNRLAEYITSHAECAKEETEKELLSLMDWISWRVKVGRPVDKTNIYDFICFADSHHFAKDIVWPSVWDYRYEDLFYNNCILIK